jgi:hypothetical protein
MSYDPPYRPATGYAQQPWPPSGYPADTFDGGSTFDGSTFDGGRHDYGGYPDLPPASTGSMPSQWHADEPVRHSPGVIAGAVMGLLAAAVAIGVATLAAAFFRPQASPVIAVGEAFIDRTPAALKEFAIQKFGEHDKMALLIGMYVTIGMLALVIGVLARRRTAIGVAGILLFGLFGAFVAYTRPASKVSDVIPSLVGGVAGVAAMLWLASAARSTSGGRA